MTGRKTPRSKLFLSCDLVGSTHFKQTEGGWQKIFLSFYREFPQLLNNSVRRHMAEHGGPLIEFELWKAVGDELIFEVEVRDEQSVANAVRVWIAAIDEYEIQVLSDRKLALKGGAFIATFPGPDSESTIPRRPDRETSDASVVELNDRALTGKKAHTQFLFDYFGPSIDTGFRLLSLCSRRHFILSIEVAWALALAAHEADASAVSSADHTVADVVYRGGYALKGVWLGRDYPVFAIDREAKDPVNEATSKLNGKKLDPMGIIDVCRACNADLHWPFQLYLPDSKESAFRMAPSDAMAELLAREASLEGAESQIKAKDEISGQLTLEAPLG